MSPVKPVQAFERIMDDLGLRSVAIGLYRIITSKNPVLILKDTHHAQLFKIVMERLTPDETRFPLSQAPIFAQAPTSAPDLTVIAEATYKEQWQTFSGREICFVADERTVKNPGVDLLMEIIVETHAEGYSKQQGISEQSLDALYETICRITETTIKILKVSELIQEGRIVLKSHWTQPKMREIMDQHLKGVKEKELVFYIFDLLQDISLKKEKILPIELKIEAFKASLEQPHLLYTFLSEHEQLLTFLDVLEDLHATFPNDFTKEEQDTLRIIAENLVEANIHYKREEEILFSRLESQDITGVPWLLRHDHDQLRSRKKQFLEYARTPESNATQLNTLMETFPHLLRDHVFKEDTILYPLVLEKLDELEDMKKEAKAIGFCQFQPLPKKLERREARRWPGDTLEAFLTDLKTARQIAFMEALARKPEKAKKDGIVKARMEAHGKTVVPYTMAGVLSSLTRRKERYGKDLERIWISEYEDERYYVLKKPYRTKVKEIYGP